MKSFTNIEKLPGKKHYTGYGAGDTWIITKKEFNWEARAQLSPGKSFRLRDLSAISEHLTKLSAEYRC